MKLSKRSRTELSAGGALAAAAAATTDHNYCQSAAAANLDARLNPKSEPAQVLDNDNSKQQQQQPQEHMDDCMAAMVLMFLSCRPEDQQQHQQQQQQQQQPMATRGRAEMGADALMLVVPEQAAGNGGVNGARGEYSLPLPLSLSNVPLPISASSAGAALCSYATLTFRLMSREPADERRSLARVLLCHWAGCRAHMSAQNAPLAARSDSARRSAHRLRAFRSQAPNGVFQCRARH